LVKILPHSRHHPGKSFGDISYKKMDRSFRLMEATIFKVGFIRIIHITNTGSLSAHFRAIHWYWLS